MLRKDTTKRRSESLFTRKRRRMPMSLISMMRFMGTRTLNRKRFSLSLKPRRTRPRGRGHPLHHLKRIKINRRMLNRLLKALRRRRILVKVEIRPVMRWKSLLQNLKMRT